MVVRNRLRARQVIHSWPVQINVWSLENKLDDLGTRIKSEKQDRGRPLSTRSCHSASTLTLSQSPGKCLSNTMVHWSSSQSTKGQTQLCALSELHDALVNHKWRRSPYCGQNIQQTQQVLPYFWLVVRPIQTAYFSFICLRCKSYITLDLTFIDKNFRPIISNIFTPVYVN